MVNMRIVFSLGVIAFGGIGCVTSMPIEKRIIRNIKTTQILSDRDYYIKKTLTWATTKDKYLMGVLRNESGNKFSYVINGKPQMLVEDASRLYIASETLHYAYGIQKEDRWAFVYDGKEDANTYDSIGLITFSKIGGHYAYSGHLGKKVTMIVDGKEGPLLDDFTTCYFSEDGNHSAYAGKINDDVSVYFDGIPGPKFRDITGMEFSPDGKRFAYGGLLNRGGTAVVDGNESEIYNSVMGKFLFSPDGTRLAYVVKKNGMFHVVENGIIGKGYENILENVGVYSPDSKRFIYGASSGNGLWFTVSNGEEGHGYKQIILDKNGFSPDSKSFAYTAVKMGGVCPVVDGAEGEAYADSLEGGAIFD